MGTIRHDLGPDLAAQILRFSPFAFGAHFFYGLGLQFDVCRAEAGNAIRGKERHGIIP